MDLGKNQTIYIIKYDTINMLKIIGQCKIMINNDKVKFTCNNQDVEILFDKNLNLTKNIQALPPYGKYTFEITSPFSFLGGKTPNTITVRIAGNSIEIPTSKNIVIVYSLLIFFFS